MQYVWVNADGIAAWLGSVTVLATVVRNVCRTAARPLMYEKVSIETLTD